MKMQFTEKTHIGNTLPPNTDGHAGELFFNLSDGVYYYHNGVEWLPVGGDPTVSHFDTYDDLRSSPTPSSPIILIAGRSVAGDGGQGFFVRDPANRADNDGTVLVDADGHSWQRVFTGDVLAIWFFGNGASVNATQFTNLYSTVETYHSERSIDWIGVEFSDTNATISMPKRTTVKRLTMNANGISNVITVHAASDPNGTTFEFIGCTFRGGGAFNLSTDDDASLIVHDSFIERVRIQLHDNAIVADSLGYNAYASTYNNSVLRNSYFMFVNAPSGLRFSDNSFVFGNTFYVYQPPYGGTANVNSGARVLNNSFVTVAIGTSASGTVSVGEADGAIFANNRVYLHRHTYPYPFAMSSPKKVLVFGNYVEAHTNGGQDATEWRFNADAEAVVVANNVWATRGGSGNYGVRIRGANGAKANAVVASNMFMNFGSRAGAGVQRRNGVGNVKFIGNVFYNWYYGMRKYDSATTVGVVEGNSNAFSNCVVGVSDPDYVNAASDTAWS